MNTTIPSRSIWTGLLIVVLTTTWVCPIFAQASQGVPRKLAPGVMIDIPPDVQATDTVSVDNVMELAAADASFDFAKDVRFRRDIWYLDFSFKPVRMIWVDVPQADGHMERKLVWYLLYSVTNRGEGLTSVEQPDKTFQVEPIQLPARFTPAIELQAKDPEVRKTPYPDKVVPLALGPIATRERVGQKLWTTITMPNQEIAVGETRWGVATWTDIDPRVDSFSIYIAGLTNAYRWQDRPQEYRPGQDPIAKGRTFTRKTLKLNFWRPGDEYDEMESEIRYGIPERDGMPREVDYEWIYR
jgi:hypothetical protein